MVSRLEIALNLNRVVIPLVNITVSQDRKVTYSAGNKFLFYPENWLWHFMQIVSIGDNLHEMSKPFFLGNKRNIFQHVICWKFYPASLALLSDLQWKTLFTITLDKNETIMVREKSTWIFSIYTTCWVKISADDIFKYFFLIFHRKIGVDTLSKFSP